MDNSVDNKYREFCQRLRSTNREGVEKIIKQFKRSKKNFFERVALFHLNFEGIHPFIDGNGRCGRLILNLMLMQEGFLPIDIKYTDRMKYYDCFKEYLS